MLRLYVNETGTQNPKTSTTQRDLKMHSVHSYIFEMFVMLSFQSLNFYILVMHITVCFRYSAVFHGVTQNLYRLTNKFSFISTVLIIPFTVPTIYQFNTVFWFPGVRVVWFSVIPISV